MVTRKPSRRRPAKATRAKRAQHVSVVADPFPALADPTRRAILDGLRRAPRTAGDIASDFAISRPGVSKHLRILEGAGLVRVVKHGRERRYHLEAAPLSNVDAWVARYRMFWSAALVRLKEHVEASLDDPGTAAPPPMDQPFMIQSTPPDPTTPARPHDTDPAQPSPSNGPALRR